MILMNDPVAEITLYLAIATFALALVTAAMAWWTRKSAFASEKAAETASESVKVSNRLASHAQEQVNIMRDQLHIMHTPEVLSIRLLILDFDIYPKPSGHESLSHTEIHKRLSDEGSNPKELFQRLIRQQIQDDQSSDIVERTRELETVDRFMASEQSDNPQSARWKFDNQGRGRFDHGDI